MTVTVIDEKPALVVIDLQKGIVHGPKAHPVEDVVANSARLAAAFRANGLPVVLVNVVDGAPGRTEFVYADDEDDESEAAEAEAAAIDDAGTTSDAEQEAEPEEWTELVPELGAQAGDLRISKVRWGAFTGSPMHETLQDLGVTQIVVTGINTQIGVETTARTGYELGYHVVLVTDAMTCGDLVAHEHSVRHIFPRLGETGTTDEVLLMLGRRLSAERLSAEQATR